MEDGLVLMFVSLLLITYGVLILVVVDEGIVQIVEGSERKEVRVLILVIVEDGLVQTIETLTQYGNAKRS